MIYVSWPEDGCNLAETFSHEVLMYYHLKLCNFIIVVPDVKYEGWNFNCGNYLFTTDTK